MSFPDGAVAEHEMSIENGIENLYLKVWRTLVLCVATAALITAVAASAAAVSGLLLDPPQPPAQIRPEDREAMLEQALSLEKFRLADRGVPAPWPGESRTPRGATALDVGEALRIISRNLDEYVKSAFPPVVPLPEATLWSVSRLLNSLDLKSDAETRLYVTTLVSLSEQLARTGPEQATLPEERRMDPHRMLRWHADTVERLVRATREENEALKKAYGQRLDDYANRNARVVAYAGLAAGAVAIFVFSVFLFVIIRIERDLRTMAVASVATSRRLEG